MRWKRQLWLFLCIAALGLWLSMSWAEDKILTDDTVSVRNEGAHHLLLPKDWPVKEENGRLAPIGIEEYMSMKFAQVRELFSVHERRFDLIEKRLKALEKNNTILQSRLSLLEEAQERDSASSK